MNKGMDPLNEEIRCFIEEKLDEGYRKFVIFPFGDVGMRVKQYLNSAYGIQEVYILDNLLCKYNDCIKPVSYMKEVEHKDFAVLFSSTNVSIYEELKKILLIYFEFNQIAELCSMKNPTFQWHTQIGKYSYGPICRDHELIECIGAFCSFATGVEVVPNHEMKFITTHPMIYGNKVWEDRVLDYKANAIQPWYFEGVEPHDECTKRKRSKIGNDVWLGRNVIITNGADIGNGVIAGAGAIITKNVPDYAVVGGFQLESLDIGICQVK